MSMSTHVKGFTPPDEEWQKMKAVWDACTTAGVPVPDEVGRFFGWEAPDPAGLETELLFRKWKSGMREGYELDVADIPAHVRTIRFWNSW
jgi:hypothetical protein